jgi:hypothetical protein
MERDLARHLIRTGFDASRQLSSLLPTLRQQLGEEEYKKNARKIAAAIDAINVALIEAAFAAHPGLKDEVEASIDKHDRFS